MSLTSNGSKLVYCECGALNVTNNTFNSDCLNAGTLVDDFATLYDSLTCYEKNATIFPFFNDTNWNYGIRICFTLAFLLWIFLSVALICDIFMCSIEKITSKTRKIHVSKPGSDPPQLHEVEVKVWNDTVANLTLMALGTSAPEIMLNVVEILQRHFVTGQLGPSTIVGSAAFNLFMISAVCIVAIPENENRRIRSVIVYYVTSVFNMFAYVWLIITLKIISPNEVEIWEAAVTLAMFPFLVLCSFLADKYQQSVSSTDTSTSAHSFGLTVDPSSTSYRYLDDDKAIKELIESIERNYKLPTEEAAEIITYKCSEKRSHSHGWYRIKATRDLTAGARLEPQISHRLKNLAAKLNGDNSGFIMPVGPRTRSVVEFTSATLAVVENCGTANVKVIRYGMLTNKVVVGYDTCNGTADAGSDYVSTQGFITFLPFEQIKYIPIPIIDDDIWEPDEFFYVQLHMNIEDNPNAELGLLSILQVTILNDDEPGYVEFDQPSYVVKESAKHINAKVNRVDGADGKIAVFWTTSVLRGESANLYANKNGIIEFLSGVVENYIDFEIFNLKTGEQDVHFQIELQAPTSGARLGKNTKTVVTIVSDKEFVGIISKIVEKTKLNLDILNVTTGDWASQFRNAMNVNGGDLESATKLDYLMHYFTFFWKVLFALIPPVSIGGGWPTFCISLLMIGGLTAIIGDIAGHFGCLVGLPDSITAITFVALGTSVPDLFASRQAALNEKYADNSIGNINGSNSVNVFLGLGLPWFLASVYWNRHGERFEVKSRDVTGTVLVFTLSAIVAVSVMMLRRGMRFFGKAELGGAVIPKYIAASIFVALWLNYVVLSSLQATGHMKLGG